MVIFNTNSNAIWVEFAHFMSYHLADYLYPNPNPNPNPITLTLILTLNQVSVFTKYGNAT